MGALAQAVVAPAPGALFGQAHGFGVGERLASLSIAPGADNAQGAGVADAASGRVVFIAFAAAVGPDDFDGAARQGAVVPDAGGLAARVGDGFAVFVQPLHVHQLHAGQGVFYQAARVVKAQALLRAAGQADGNAVFAADVFVADFGFGFAPRFVSEAVHPGDQTRAVERRGMVARAGHGRDGAAAAPAAASCAAAAAGGPGDGVYGDWVVLQFDLPAFRVRAAADVAARAVFVVPDAASRVAGFEQPGVRQRRCRVAAGLYRRGQRLPFVADAVALRVLHAHGQQSAAVVNADDLPARVVFDAQDAAGFIAYQAGFDARRTAPALHAPLRVVVNGVARLVVPLPARDVLCLPQRADGVVFVQTPDVARFHRACGQRRMAVLPRRAGFARLRCRQRRGRDSLVDALSPPDGDDGRSLPG